MALDIITYRDGDTVLEGAVARPTGGGQAPGVIVIHAWAGRGPDENAAAQRLAEAGYVGIAIDVFGQGHGGDPAGDNSHLIAPWLADRAALLRRLMAGVAFARGLEGVAPGGLAAIGYCFGGLCALDLARGGGDAVAGVVSLHGLLTPTGLPGSRITARVLVEHGWRDPLAPPDSVLGFAQEMADADADADWQVHAHGRAMHAFTNRHAASPERGMAYDADADRRSWGSVMAFLAELVER